MSDFVEIILIGAACAAGVGLMGLFVLQFLRGRSLRLKLFAVTATMVAAMVAGTRVAAQAMFISKHDLGVVTIVCVASGVVALGIALLLGRSVGADSRALQLALRALGTERDGLSDPTGLATGELAEVSKELAATSVRLAESRERERALERSRRELVAWVSHDLRTPLAGLRAMSEALEDGVATDPSRYHRQMRQAVDRLAGMVDDLFELSRIHAGALRLSLERVTLAELVDEAVITADPLARARGVALLAEVRTPLAVRVDLREVSRALTNLVVNAIRHTPGDGAVRLVAAEHDGCAVLTVTDACGGIPEDDLERVFEVAWRGTAARTPEPQSGAGLGLAIVRGIVEAHAGEVDVRNVLGGCRFEMRLPVPAM